MSTIDIQPKRTTRLSFERFLALTPADRHNIAGTRIVLPSFGTDIGDTDAAFGEIEVLYKNPVYFAEVMDTAIASRKVKALPAQRRGK